MRSDERAGRKSEKSTIWRNVAVTSESEGLSHHRRQGFLSAVGSWWQALEYMAALAPTRIGSLCAISASFCSIRCYIINWSTFVFASLLSFFLFFRASVLARVFPKSNHLLLCVCSAVILLHFFIRPAATLLYIEWMVELSHSLRQPISLGVFT